MGVTDGGVGGQERSGLDELVVLSAELSTGEETGWRVAMEAARATCVQAAIEEAGGLAEWQRVMQRSAELYDAIEAAGLDGVGAYAIPMAYRVRFYMEMNAREAMHVLELRLR